MPLRSLGLVLTIDPSSLPSAPLLPSSPLPLARCCWWGVHNQQQPSSKVPCAPGLQKRRNASTQNFSATTGVAWSWSPWRLGGSEVALLFVESSAVARAGEAPPTLFHSAALAWRRGWTRMLAISRARPFACSLVVPPNVPHAHGGECDFHIICGKKHTARWEPLARTTGRKQWKPDSTQQENTERLRVQTRVRSTGKIGEGQTGERRAQQELLVPPNNHGRTTFLRKRSTTWTHGPALQPVTWDPKPIFD